MDSRTIQGGDATEMGSEKTAGDLRKSCDLCCSRKRRCDGDGVNACSLCSAKGAMCTYSKKGRRGPKPKPKRLRVGHSEMGMGFGALALSPEEEEGFGEDGMISNDGVLEWGDGQNSLQATTPPPPENARTTNAVALSSSRPMGTIGRVENDHLNSFFSGFGACTQIVQEDEIRGAMIYILNGGHSGTPVFGSDYLYPSSSIENTTSVATQRGSDREGQHLALVQVGDGAADSGRGEGAREQRAQRARLSAGAACLWAGIGVGAMLCGHTSEATKHYAENARDAMKGCYDVVSEQVLRALLCLAHLHSFRGDLRKFSQYRDLAVVTATALDRQSDGYRAQNFRTPDSRMSTPKGCSEPARFLLDCFDALSQFLQVEREEPKLPIEGSNCSSDATSGVGPTGLGTSEGDAQPSTAVAGESSGNYAARGGLRGGSHVISAVAVDQGRSSGNGVGAKHDEEPRAHGKENQPRNATGNGSAMETPLSVLETSASSDAGGREEDRLAGFVGTERDKEFLNVLRANPISQRSSSSASLSWTSLSGRKDRQGPRRQISKGFPSSGRLLTNGTADADGAGDEFSGWDLSGRAGGKEGPKPVNQVLFVGDTRILEVSMSVDNFCVNVMYNAVKGADWSEVMDQARLVAEKADGILRAVLASETISRSVCAVKLLADAAFAHLCLGNAADVIRAVQRFCAILKVFPGIMRFPPWKHCFHWMAGMLESAGLRKEYDGLRDGLTKIKMKEMQSLPAFGKGAHDIMCKCTHFRCQATHRALAEHAKRDPYGRFRVPDHCPRYGVAAHSTDVAGTLTFRANPQASPWATASRSSSSQEVGSGGGQQAEGPPAAGSTASPAPATLLSAPAPVIGVSAPPSAPRLTPDGASPGQLAMALPARGPVSPAPLPLPREQLAATQSQVPVATSPSGDGMTAGVPITTSVMPANMPLGGEGISRAVSDDLPLGLVDGSMIGTGTRIPGVGTAEQRGSSPGSSASDRQMHPGHLEDGCWYTRRASSDQVHPPGAQTGCSFDALAGAAVQSAAVGNGSGGPSLMAVDGDVGPESLVASSYGLTSPAGSAHQVSYCRPAVSSCSNDSSGVSTDVSTSMQAAHAGPALGLSSHAPMCSVHLGASTATHAVTHYSAAFSSDGAVSDATGTWFGNAAVQVAGGNGTIAPALSAAHDSRFLGDGSGNGIRNGSSGGELIGREPRGKGQSMSTLDGSKAICSFTEPVIGASSGLCQTLDASSAGTGAGASVGNILDHLWSNGAGTATGMGRSMNVSGIPYLMGNAIAASNGVIVGSESIAGDSGPTPEADCMYNPSNQDLLLLNQEMDESAIDTEATGDLEGLVLEDMAHEPKA